jgi:adenine phosphoribosyltransferase
VARRCPVFASEALAYSPPFTFMAQSNFSDFLKARVRTIPGWPKAGVNFRDVTTLFHDPEAFRVMVEAFALDCTQQRIDLIAAVDARGFIVGGALAYQLHKPFVLVRKKGKLPHKTISADYALEYGTATVEIHADACKPGDRILILDDLIATGGTLLAATQLFRRLGGVVVGVAGIIDLPELGGSAKLRAAGLNVHTLCEFSENE